MEERIKSVLIEALEIQESEFTPEISMKNHPSWDSLSQLKVIVGLEDQFKVQFSEPEILELVSYSNILEILKNK